MRPVPKGHDCSICIQGSKDPCSLRRHQDSSVIPINSIKSPYSSEPFAAVDKHSKSWGRSFTTSPRKAPSRGISSPDALRIVSNPNSGPNEPTKSTSTFKAVSRTSDLSWRSASPMKGTAETATG